MRLVSIDVYTNSYGFGGANGALNRDASFTAIEHFSSEQLSGVFIESVKVWGGVGAKIW